MNDKPNEDKTYTMELTHDEIGYLLSAVYSVSGYNEARELKFKLIEATLAGKRDQK